ncbi:MAG TPA: hypothetical protein VH640_22120, partial [Bryobacteraceae bacterium]
MRDPKLYRIAWNVVPPEFPFVARSVLHVSGMGDTQNAAQIALLAPVPSCHLESARALAPGQVAFASKDWRLFNKLENELEQAGPRTAVDVYIYES